MGVDLKVKYYDDPEVEVAWNEFKFWQNSEYNEDIAHSLVDDEVVEDDYKFLINFWDENFENQSILESLIEQEEKHPPIKNEEDEFIWDEKDIALSLIDIEPDAEKVNPKENAYIWNDLETLKLLLMTKDDEEPELKTKKELFPWEDPDYIKLLF